MALDIVVEEIRRLSQEEGLNDSEIADILKCSRATVNRIRLKYGIDKANLANRKDKTYKCARCGITVTIRRKERRKFHCPTCANKVRLEEQNQRLLGGTE